MATVYVAWDSRTESEIGASFYVDELQKHVNELDYAWSGEWYRDEDGAYLRRYVYNLDTEKVIIERIPFVGGWVRSATP